MSQGWKRFKLTRDVVQILCTSIGLAIFVEQQWISPDNSFFSNVMAGVALYVGARIVAHILVR